MKTVRYDDTRSERDHNPRNVFLVTVDLLIQVVIIVKSKFSCTGIKVFTHQPTFSLFIAIQEFGNDSA